MTTTRINYQDFFDALSVKAEDAKYDLAAAGYYDTTPGHCVMYLVLALAGIA